MRFSFWPAPGQPFSEVRLLAEHVAASGWDGLWYADHFMPNEEDTSAPMPECWATLAALASCVADIRLGALVSGNTYRHPAVLAKMVATVDHISGGRAVLGLGAGWQENEHRQYGIHFGTLKERMARLEEACQVIRLLYSETKANFDGRYYQLDNASCEPKPIAAPLLIGGGGERRTLRITAQYADEWNVWGDVATLKHKMAVLDEHCRDVGRNPADIQRSAVALLFMSEDAGWVKGMRDRNIGRPSIIGTPAEVRDIVAQYAEAGVNEIIVPDFTLGPRDAKLATLDTFIRVVAGR